MSAPTLLEVDSVPTRGHTYHQVVVRILHVVIFVARVEEAHMVAPVVALARVLKEARDGAGTLGGRCPRLDGGR